MVITKDIPLDERIVTLRCFPSEGQLSLPGLATAPRIEPLGREMRGRLFQLRGDVRDAATHYLPTAMSDALTVPYVLASEFYDPAGHHAWTIVGPSGERAWVTRCLLRGTLRATTRFPLRLWGRTPLRLDALDAEAADDHDPLVACCLATYVAANHRLGATVLSATVIASSTKPLVFFSSTSIPTWPA